MSREEWQAGDRVAVRHYLTPYRSMKGVPADELRTIARVTATLIVLDDDSRFDRLTAVEYGHVRDYRAGRSHRYLVSIAECKRAIVANMLSLLGRLRQYGAFDPDRAMTDVAEIIDRARAELKGLDG